MISSHRSQGFTLIEVAVALAILSLVLGGALSVVSQYSDERLRLHMVTRDVLKHWKYGATRAAELQRKYASAHA